MNNHPNSQIPESGEVVAVSVDGQLYINPANADYLKSQSPSSLNKIESKTINHTGFSRGKVISNSSDDREETLERLNLLKNQRARLFKDLERVNSVIKSIESDLSI